MEKRALRRDGDKGKDKKKARSCFDRAFAGGALLVLAVDGLWSGKRNYLPFGLVENGRCLS
jgi:hypothetical protein